MQHIFISTLQQPISSWKQAFADCLLVKNMTELNDTYANITQLDKHAPNLKHDYAANADIPLFWLHLNGATQTHLLEVVRGIRWFSKDARIIVLDNAPNHETSIKALSAGVVGYAHAYSPPEVLIEIKAVVTHGGLWLGQQLLQRLIETTTKLTGNNPAHVGKLLELLTKRERQVALQAAKGLSNKEIARQLDITERTVKAHLAASFERLKVKDRLQLALLLNKQESAETVDTTQTPIKRANLA